MNDLSKILSNYSGCVLDRICIHQYFILLGIDDLEIKINNVLSIIDSGERFGVFYTGEEVKAGNLLFCEFLGKQISRLSFSEGILIDFCGVQLWAPLVKGGESFEISTNDVVGIIV